MRKLLSFTLATIMLLSLLVACGGETATTAPTSGTTAAATTAPAGGTTAAATTAPATTAPTSGTDAATTAPASGGMEMPAVDPATVTGDIISAGSSTVFPLSEAVAELFKQEGYAGDITIDSVGTGAGFERFCTAAETDIANASRPIKDSEAEACKAKGREPVEFRVGTDALAVVVSAQNTFVSDLSKAQLSNIYSGTYKLWSDVDASYPKEPIKLYSPGTDSGTFDYFVEVLFAKKKELLLGANPQLSEDDNVLVKGVEDDQYAIGYFGYAYFNENKGKLKALKIEGVEPNFASAEDGSYPLARPLYIYSSQDILAAKPQVVAFISFYLTNVNDLIGDVGYFPASDEALAEAQQALLDTMK
jgi:phosphate binding protein